MLKPLWDSMNQAKFGNSKLNLDDFFFLRKMIRIFEEHRKLTVHHCSNYHKLDGFGKQNVGAKMLVDVWISVYADATFSDNKSCLPGCCNRRIRSCL